MTKAQIIQRLLDEKHITVEEAMTLMTQEPMPMPAPVNPYSPPLVGDTDWTCTLTETQYGTQVIFNYENKPEYEDK
jgi:hypothetical protein